MPPSCALLGGFAIGAQVALLWQHHANPSYKLASIPRYDDIVRTIGGICACRRVTGGVLKIVRHIWEVGVAGWSVTRRGGGILNITAVARTAGFHWWRSGNIMRMQNVSEYMTALALCLVFIVVYILNLVTVLTHSDRPQYRILAMSL